MPTHEDVLELAFPTRPQFLWSSLGRDAPHVTYILVASKELNMAVQEHSAGSQPSVADTGPPPELECCRSCRFPAV